MYFDPGMRQYISIEKLVNVWHSFGIKAIYAAGWHFYKKYTFDYERLIKCCHEKGILVYCWLEPPLVSKKFWDDHPLWREKTATLKDATVAWRSLMNLADPACMKEVLNFTDNLLSKYDWDGVNLSELYFESAQGPDKPDIFTPMNDTVRHTFQNQKKFDPIDLFNRFSVHYWKANPEDWSKFVTFRTALCMRLREEFIKNINEMIKAKKKDFQVMMTIIDPTLVPEIGPNIAEDLNTTLFLQKKYNFSLQVEDPANCWSGKPERYDTLGTYYRKFIPEKSNLLLDCNILDSHKDGLGGLPLEKPSGEEMRQIAYNMDLNDIRPAFYSEATININDIEPVNSVLARKADVSIETENLWRISTPYMVTLRTGRKDFIANLDGEAWFADSDEGVIIPSGDHTLHFESGRKYFDLSKLKPHLSYISGELRTASFSNNSVEFSYAEPNMPCYVVLNKRPGKILIDGTKRKCSVLESFNGFSIKLPSGMHTVRIQIAEGISWVLESSGMIFLSLAIVFGFISSVLFTGMFILIKLKRGIFK